MVSHSFLSHYWIPPNQQNHPLIQVKIANTLQYTLVMFYVLQSVFLLVILQEEKPIATRKTSQACIEAYSQFLPELMGGSADLAESNNVKGKNATPFSIDNPRGNYLHYGVREFGMSAIMNGLSLHKGVISFCGKSGRGWGRGR